MVKTYALFSMSHHLDLKLIPFWLIAGTMVFVHLSRIISSLVNSLSHGSGWWPVCVYMGRTDDEWRAEMEIIDIIGSFDGRHCCDVADQTLSSASGLYLSSHHRWYSLQRWKLWNRMGSVSIILNAEKSISPQSQQANIIDISRNITNCRWLRLC